MPSNPSLINFFGPGFTQDLEKFTIMKADLMAPSALPADKKYEFTPAAANTSESIFLALFLRAQANQDVSLDSQMVITDFQPTLEYRYGRWQRVYSCSFTVYIDDLMSTFPNPNSV